VVLAIGVGKTEANRFQNQTVLEKIKTKLTKPNCFRKMVWFKPWTLLL